MNNPETGKKHSRARASDRAFRIALKAMQDAGLQIQKVVVIGGQIEIHCGSTYDIKTEEDGEGLKDW